MNECLARAAGATECTILESRHLAWPADGQGMSIVIGRMLVTLVTLYGLRDQGRADDLLEPNVYHNRHVRG